MRNNYSGALILSVALHVLLIIALIFGGIFTSKEAVKPKAQNLGQSIKVVAVDPVVVQRQALKIKREREAVKRAEQKRKERLEKEAQALELKRKQAEEKIKRLEKERLLAEKKAQEAKLKEKKRLKEQKVAEEKARIAKEKADKLEAQRQVKLEEKRKADAAAKKAEQERQAKLEEKRKAEEAARKAREEEEAARKKAAEEKAKAEKARKEREAQEALLNDMFADIDAESAQRQSAKSKMVADEINRNAAVFQNLIQQHLRINDNMLGKQCQLSLNLAKNGFVLSVDNAQGNSALCGAARTAVLEIAQFPMPEDPNVVAQMRKIRLVVEPQ